MKESKPLSISQQMRATEALGSKVAKIINKAQLQANKVLAESGYAINVETTPDGVKWTCVELPKKEEVNPNG